MKRDHHHHRLERYNAMRDFDVTSEPAGDTSLERKKDGHSFVVQKHAARRLHYDFRLEHQGTLLSWAVPKGPSLKPGDKRLAVQTEDHPIDYRDFEGTIPKGQYGGGAVIVWDRGTWKPEEADVDAALKKGHLGFTLDGEKLHGRYVLVRTRGQDEKKPSWLLIKRTDEHARADEDIVTGRPESILTGRTIEDVEAGVPAEVVKKTRRKKTAAAARGKKSKLRGAKLPPFGSIGPELATLVKSVPRAQEHPGEWIYEIKYDGYRTLAWLDDGEVRLASRRGLDWSAKYPLVKKALSKVRAKNAIFDGEIAYVLEDGRTDFQRLQNTLGSMSADGQARLVYFIFDLLFYDGVDLRDQPLSIRKDKLRTILAGEKPPLMMSDDVGDGEAFFREACKMGLEGIIGKRADRPYVSTRSKDWIKVKCDQRQELVIVGFTPPKGHRKGIGALLMGTRDANTKTLRYAGKVGTGFSNATLDDLYKRLTKIEIDKPPISNPPARKKEARWVKPELVAEVRFSEWTSDGVLRHPSFQGLRFDKTAQEVQREKALPVKAVTKEEGQELPAPVSKAPETKSSAKPRVAEIVISHPERVIDSASGHTKLDLAEYAGTISEVMLPYIAKRPLMLFRCPSGTQTEIFRQSDKRQGKKVNCFVQKHSGQGVSGSNLSSTMINGEEALYVTEETQIVALAQNNTFEIHGWGSTLPKWDRPDWIVLDLDPDEALPFKRVRDAAFEVRDALKTLKLESWVKTTGGKGLHVVVPIARRYDWATVKAASHRIALLLAEGAPDRYVATISKRARTGKIFVDYLRNGEGATAVLPYSPRARPGLPVAMPIEWKDLPAIEEPREEFTIATVPSVIEKRRRDPWEELLTTRQPLPKDLLRAL